MIRLAAISSWFPCLSESASALFASAWPSAVDRSACAAASALTRAAWASASARVVLLNASASAASFAWSRSASGERALPEGLSLGVQFRLVTVRRCDGALAVGLCVSRPPDRCLQSLRREVRLAPGERGSSLATQALPTAPLDRLVRPGDS
jgi:hypothetical protein